MTAIFSAILYTAAVLIAILLVALVLVQPSKSGGFGSAFGGVGEGVFGAQAMGHLSKVTVVLIAVFFIVTLALAAVSGHRQKTASAVSSSAAMTTTAKAPAAKPVKKAPAAEKQKIEVQKNAVTKGSEPEEK